MQLVGEEHNPTMKTYVIELAGRDPRSALNEHAEGSVTVQALSRRHAVGAPLDAALHHQHPVIGGVELHEWRVTGVSRAIRSVYGWWRPGSPGRAPPAARAGESE